MMKVFICSVDGETECMHAHTHYVSNSFSYILKVSEYEYAVILNIFSEHENKTLYFNKGQKCVTIILKAK